MDSTVEILYVPEYDVIVLFQRDLSIGTDGTSIKMFTEDQATADLLKSGGVTIKNLEHIGWL